ncbi:hypothetical protein [Dokdonella soli]|uniref:Uncharacterized protein n=1 Tax=Dokdonella soli TaxID=529810 RepID=A0ABN1IIN3_9GAMM
MRTHLLRTVASAETEPAADTGHAVNDDRYGARAVLMNPAPSAPTTDNVATDSENEDRYYLGGYAGI